MQIEVRMPSLGQTTDELTILKWMKKEGDRIEKGEAFLEVESDKASIVVEAFCSGTVSKIMVSEGEIVSAGDIIAYIIED